MAPFLKFKLLVHLLVQKSSFVFRKLQISLTFKWNWKLEAKSSCLTVVWPQTTEITAARVKSHPVVHLVISLLGVGKISQLCRKHVNCVPSNQRYWRVRALIYSHSSDTSLGAQRLKQCQSKRVDSLQTRWCFRLHFSPSRRCWAPCEEPPHPRELKQD